MPLIRSKDRKVTNAVSPNGKTATISNTFGLPSGKVIPVLEPQVYARKSATQASLKKSTRA